MKKLLLASMLTGASAFASDITGIIQKIDNAQKTITLNGNNTIKVMPYTKIEQDACENGWDTPKRFADLNIGQVVEIDFMGVENNILIAKEIEIQCANRAY